MFRHSLRSLTDQIPYFEQMETSGRETGVCHHLLCIKEKWYYKKIDLSDNNATIVITGSYFYKVKNILCTCA